MKIYTKGGDKGSTSLIGGRRVRKSDLQVEVYGQIDELNSWIGLLASYRKVLDEDDREFLYSVQQDLFKIGGFYSFDFASGKVFEYPFIQDSDIERIEKAIDKIQEQLPPLKEFILPGGIRAAAQTHVARTVCRRCERTMDRFEGVPDSMRDFEQKSKSYLNRLSDYLFVLARYENLCSEGKGFVF